MDEFAPVVVRRQSLFAPGRSTLEEKRWGSYKTLAKEQLPGVVTGVCFSPRLPYELAAAADMGLSLIDTSIGEVRKTIGRFKDLARSPNFKPDGKLLVAGCDNGITQVFDVSNRSILRQFKGHTGAVWSSKFTVDGLRVLTGSDDFTVRMWDLPTGKGLFSLTDAKDYIRAQAPSPSSKHVWCVGSYDRTARVYDLRTKKVLFSLDHGSQIDDVLILPGGVRAVTVGGTDVKVWDFFTGGRLISKLSNHAKAVTSCVVHPSGDRLLTSGLDGQIKVQDLTSFEVSAAMYYPSPIVSLAISPDGKRVGTGSTDGTAEIRVVKGFKDDLPRSAPGGGLKERQFEGWGGGFEKPKREGPRPGSRRYFDRGAFSKADDEDVVVDFKRQGANASYDRYLRSFSHGKALEAAIKTKDPGIVVSVIEELASRKALRNALAGCTDEAVEEQLQLILKNIDLPAYTARLSQLLNIILDVHGKDFGQGDFVDELLNRIFSKVRDEVKIGHQLNRLQGSLAMIMNVASVN